MDVRLTVGLATAGAPELEYRASLTKTSQHRPCFITLIVGCERSFISKAQADNQPLITRLLVRHFQCTRRDTSTSLAYLDSTSLAVIYATVPHEPQCFSTICNPSDIRASFTARLPPGATLG